MAVKVAAYSRFLLISFYVFAGAYHFIQPKFYIGLIPDYLSYPYFINYLSGALEILLALGVVFKKTRKFAAMGIILLLIAFIPAHVHFIQIGSCLKNSLCVPAWVAWLRLIFIHPLLILWAWKIRD